VQALGDQFLAGAALADHQHRAAHRRGAAGAFHRVEKGGRLADELISPLHGPEYSEFRRKLAILTKWQEPPIAQPVDFLVLPKVGTPVAKVPTYRIWEVQTAMYNRRFFATNLGRAAAASIAAMVAFNIFAITQQLDMNANAAIAAAPMVELA
jgi:hypothetical protein